MGLIQKQVHTLTKQLYSLPSDKVFLIVGLGNPGKEYAKNRHNLGFMTVDEFAKIHELGGWSDKKTLSSSVIGANFNGSKIILAKPMTYMNNSGLAVNALMHFFEVTNANVLVIHDELDIEFGKIRTATGGGDAGHNGLKSVISHIGKDFNRIRVGIGPKTPKNIDSADFVLKNFSKKQAQELPKIITETVVIIEEWLAGGKLEPDTRTVTL